MKAVVVVLRTALCASLFTGLPARAQWETDTNRPLPLGLCEHTAVAADNGRIYVVGGVTGSGPYTRVSDVSEYDPVANSWRSRAPIEVEGGVSTFGSAAFLNGEIYVFGGRAGAPPDERVLNSLLIYNVTADTWRSGTDMPAPRFGSSVGVVNGQIVIAGGAETLDGIPVTTTWLYIAEESGSYVTKASMPDGLPTVVIPAVGLGGKLHVFGGSDGSLYLIYDLVADTWSSGLPRPPRVPVIGPGVAATSSTIYVSGGADPNPPFDPSRTGDGLLQVLLHAPSGSFDPVWSEGPWMDMPLQKTSAAIANGKIYSLGGLSLGVCLRINQSFGVAP